MRALFPEPPTLPAEDAAHAVALGVAYVVCAPSLLILAASGAAAELLDQVEGEVVGRLLADVCLPLVGCEPELAAICAGKLSHLLIEQVNGLDRAGEPRYTSLVALPHSAGLLLILSDVTLQSVQQQRLQQQHHELLLLHEQVAEQNRRLKSLNEELVAVSQRKSDMLAIATHDLRSPLTVIIGYAQLLVGGVVGEISEVQRESLDAINSQSREMLQLINRLLDLRRLEATSVSQREPLPLNGMLEQVARSFSDQARLADVKVLCEPGDDVLMLGDWDAMLQAVVNLVSNGVKYTPPGGTVTLSCRPLAAPPVLDPPLSPEGRWCVLEVRDTGRGIAPADLERLFTPFFRTAAARESATPGSGLGLSIVQTVVDQHGGRVLVESQLGKGSTFTLVMPGDDLTADRERISG